MALLLLLLAAALVGASSVAFHRRPVEVDRSEKSFAQMMTGAMEKMTQGAMATPMVGYPDRDFAAMMIVHHLGAVEMAQSELLHGRDPVLRRLAQEIVVTQTAEIAVLREQLGKADGFCR
jgi:uncharacterized protein (DUF305 family)